VFQQLHDKKVKNKNPEQCFELLEKNGVNPSPAACLELNEFKKSKPDNSKEPTQQKPDKSKEPKQPPSPSDSVLSTVSFGSNVGNNNKKKPTMDDNCEDDIADAVSQIHLTPPRVKSKVSVPFDDRSQASARSTRSTGSSLQEPPAPVGTAQHPQVICVHPNFPERRWPFLDKKVDKCTHSDMARNVWFIECCPNSVDIDEWVAFVPDDKVTPEALLNRVVAIQVPTLCEFQKERKPVQEAIVCPSAETEDNNLFGDIASNDHRMHQHFLLVFPSGVVLDNTVMSPGRRQVGKTVAPVKNGDLHGVFATWLISEKGGKPLADDSQRDKVDLKTLWKGKRQKAPCPTTNPL